MARGYRKNRVILRLQGGEVAVEHAPLGIQIEIRNYDDAASCEEQRCDYCKRDSEGNYYHAETNWE